MDIITYALSKKIAAHALSGVQSMSVNGQTLIINTKDSGVLTITFPTPKDGVSVTDIDVNANNQIVFTMSDGTEIISGKIPTVKGDKGDAGFSPTITENADNTDKIYKLDVTTANGKFTTPNLKGADGTGGTGDSGEENIIDSISVNGVNVTPDENKNVDITVPTITNDLTDELKSSYDEAVAAKHTHDNKTVLDSITAEKVEAWDKAEENVQSDWNETDDTADGFIKNKPTIPDITGLATETYVDNKVADYTKTVDLADVAKSGSYNDLTDKPTIPSLDGYAKTSEIPSKVSELENDSNYLSSIPEEYVTDAELESKGYLTEHQDISGKVDKVEGKSLISDTEIARLATVDNYDDTAIKAEIAKKADATAIPSKVSELTNNSNYQTAEQVNSTVTTEIAKVVADAPEDLNTLKEMSDWIASHENDASAMNSAISDNKTAITALQTGKADKSEVPTTVSELTDSSSYAKKTDIPTTLPANGGNSDTVNGHTVKSDVPENAVFTDTTYSDATQIEHGLMSVDDKKKLDGLKKYTPDGTTITADEDGTLHGQSKVDEMTGATADKDGTSGTVPAPKAGEENMFLRGDGTWAKVSGGSSIAPKATVDPAISSGNAKVTISWGDPEDVVLDGAVLSAWKGTKLVMKESGYPDNESDGALILDNTVRDAYKTSGYVVDGLTNGNTYYFKLFPYSTDGIYNYQDSNKLLGNPSLVKLDSCTNMSLSLAMGSVTVSWTDPEATKTVDGNTATWAKTVLVYKQGSIAPMSISDGIIAVEETVQNTYSTSGFEVLGLTDGQEYTFALFAISTENSYSDAVSASVQLWATLNITTTETTLYEKEVTVTNHVSTVTGTFSSTGSISLNIPWIGSTVITATDGTETGDETIEITAYMDTYSLQFSFVPDGETITPVDDVAILLKCAGIKDKSYTTMDELLADEQAMGDITMSENAMKYLARSTGFADAVCANEAFMTLLGASPYVDATVLNSDIWVKYICNSAYFESVLCDKVPTMTSNTEPYGECFCDSVFQNSAETLPYHAFADDNYGWIGSNINGGYVGYKFVKPINVRRVHVLPTFYNSSRAKDIKIEGSNDGKIWNVLFEGSYENKRYSSAIIHILPNNHNYYLYYRLNIVSTFNDLPAITSLQFYGRTNK